MLKKIIANIIGATIFMAILLALGAPMWAAFGLTGIAAAVASQWRDR